MASHSSFTRTILVNLYSLVQFLSVVFRSVNTQGPNPGDRPRFTGQDLDPNSLAVTEDQAGRPLIDFSMKGDAIQRFRLYTAKNIGHFLTITLDGKVLESAVIQSPITGQTILVGTFTQQQARALVAALRYGSLPVELKQQG